MNFFIHFLNLNFIKFPIFLNNNYYIKNSKFNHFFNNLVLNYNFLNSFNNKFKNFLNSPIKLTNNNYFGLYLSRPNQPNEKNIIVTYCEF